MWFPLREQELMLSPFASHHDFEGAPGDVLPSEPHVNHVVPGLRRCVEDVKGPVLVLDHISFHFSAVRSDHNTGYLPLPGSFSVHHESNFLSDANGRPNAGSWRRQKICFDIKAFNRFSS